MPYRTIKLTCEECQGQGCQSCNHTGQYDQPYHFCGPANPSPKVVAVLDNLVKELFEANMPPKGQRTSAFDTAKRATRPPLDL